MEKNSTNVELSPNINYVHVIGKVIKEVTPSHLFDGKMHYFLKVQVDHGEEKKADIIQAFIPEDMIVAENNHIIDIGDTVNFVGNLVHTRIEGKLDVSVLAKTIEVVDESTEHLNILYLEGKIFKSYELKLLKNNKMMKNIIVRHDSSEYEGKYFTIKAVTWNSLAKRLDSDYKEGDTIVIKGRFKSREVPTTNSKLINLHEVLVNVLIDKDSE